jgi:hypothetical protein
VSVVIPEVVVPLRVRELGEKLQLLSDGNPVQEVGAKLSVPVNPFMAVNVSVVEPELPGLATMIVCGFATTPKSGPGVTVSIRKAAAPV